MTNYTITSFTTDSSVTTSRIAQKDLLNSGRIVLEFHICKNLIGLSIAGFTTIWRFTFNPKNDKQRRINQEFIERFVMLSNDADALMNIINLKKLQSLGLIK